MLPVGLVADADVTDEGAVDARLLHGFEIPDHPLFGDVGPDTQYQYTASGVSSGTFRNDSRIRAIEGVSQAASRHETEKAATASSNNEIRFITILHLQVRSPPKGYQN